MIFERIYKPEELIQQGKALIIYGPRRVGKTTLLKLFLQKTSLRYKLDFGDNIKIQQLFSSHDFNAILEYAEGYDLIALDEAQYIPNISMGLKILVDQVPSLYVVAIGSSSFELAGQVGEPLTGRKRTLILYPLSQKELNSIYTRYELKEKLHDFLIFGTYPEVVTAKTRQQKIEILEELVHSYLLKDILALNKIKSSKTLADLLKLLAFQVSNLVSLNELAVQLKVDVKTVGRYLDLLEKSFVIKKIPGFSKNLRKEITTKAKYFFVDNGIRNGVISQYNPLDLRNDTGSLWENFIVMERIKKLTFERTMPVSFYFWRTYNGQEIDLIEQREDGIFAYECKYSQQKVKTPGSWLKNYPESHFTVINKTNYLDFLL
ncbi:ATP-binding protein [Desulfohalobiaceae bacterium Ax17]|uniref:ATP-binding protein n=1 Tax=Desulfovulcanus ferrireducens TaxID=2831190 RepID=UPI00207BAB8C|nr:ATP-binding protein [Desulfovulcanus ferrireducens]MBT8764317.1 ATP-binding protein [Desulfovulcanus ferrireducens]